MKKHKQIHRQRTAWHPLFVRTLRRALPRTYFQIRAEWPLGEEPLRQDAIVVRKKKLPPGYAAPLMAGLVSLLGEFSLLNVKGATAYFDWQDYLHLWACAALFCRDEVIESPDRVRLIAVAPRMTERCREQVRRRGRLLVEHETLVGVSAVQGSDHLMWVLETELVTDSLLHLFSQSFLRAPMRHMPLLCPEEQAIVMSLLGDVRQLNRTPNLRMRYPDYEDVTMSLDQFMQELVAQMPAHVRLKGLPAEERLKGLPAEERLKGLPAEERLDLLVRTLEQEGLSQELREHLLRRLLAERP